MKKIISILLTMAMCIGLISRVSAAEEQTLVMTVGSPTMTVDGAQTEVDPGMGTTPVILNDRTVLPVRAAVEALGGEVAWDAETRTATLTYNEDEIQLVIDSTTAYLNGEAQTLDVSPVIINDRTFLPIRFIAEGFGWSVDWNTATQEVTIVKPATEETDITGETEETPAPQKLEAYNANFDLEKGTVMLNSGYEMPILGIGTFNLSLEQAENSVYNALKDGYRLIDTANAYRNERGVGRGIQKAIDEGIVTRDEIFVTTKLWVSEYERVEDSIDETLERLGLDYVDLLLLHQPYGEYIEGYKGMEKAVEEGKVRSIGISNFYEKKFDQIMEIATIPPAVLQNESHPYYHDITMKEYMAKYGTILEAWFPLGGGDTATQAELFSDPTILKIGEKYGKTAPQIILRWHLQVGTIAIPGSTNPDHIAENFDIFDFELTDEDMAELNALNKGERSWNVSEEDAERQFTGSVIDFDPQE